VKRRQFIALLGGTVGLYPLAVCAEQNAIKVLGYLGNGPSVANTPHFAAIREGLREYGYIEGQNLAIEYRWAHGRYDQLPELAADLVRRNIDIMLVTGTPGIEAAKAATSTIPVVFFGGTDPIKTGTVASFNRPGSNITGVTFIDSEVTLKRFELLSELVPHGGLIALLVNPSNSGSNEVISSVQEAATAKGFRLQILKAASEHEINAMFDSLSQLQANAPDVAADPFLYQRRKQLVSLSSRCGVPTIYQWREFVEIGGLMSYGANINSLARDMGGYAGKIVNGVKPADLPIQQPTRFELVINLNTARALGITVPQSLLARADEVIE
jgi:putative ABC transport system substrate-binding protein